MQATSSLTAYAGQTVLLSGSSSLTTANYAASLSAGSTLTAKSSVLGAATLSASSTLYTSGRSLYGASSDLPALTSVGGVISSGSGFGNAAMQPMFSQGEEEAYTVTALVFAYGNMPVMVSSGIITKSAPGDGSVSIAAMSSMGGVGGYGSGSVGMPAFTSIGVYGLRNVAYLFSNALMLSPGINPTMDAIVVFNSAGQLSDTIAGTKEYIQSIISAINGSSQFSVIGEFSAEVMSFIASSAFNIGQTVVNGVTAPSLNDSSRVWVVNMETMASSQYEDYGFTHLFNHAGAGHGIADDGIYKLTGDTDAGADISALLEIGRSNYGSDKIKKIHKVWIGVGSDDTMYLKADADGTTVLYKTREFSTDVKNHEVLTGKRLYGNFWNWTIMNKDGADFVLATVDFQPVELNRRQR
ncbi:MAG: hypothetical protein PF589_12275 [Gammaproteobacteria bacterium]|jgi:hypothetical protein|nr:hypothetical protein [Gammaproteobacteria bacterium]